MAKPLRKAQERLKRRQERYDNIKNPKLRRMHIRPGSMNKKKG